MRLVTILVLTVLWAAPGRADTSWQTQLEEYLNLSAMRQKAVPIATKCNREFSLQRYGKVYGDSYENTVLAWGRYMASGNLRLAALTKEVIDGTLQQADKLAALVALQNPKTEAELDSAWEGLEASTIRRCRIEGVKQLGTSRR